MRCLARAIHPAPGPLAIRAPDCNPGGVTPPEGLPTLDEFNTQNEARRGSHVLSYGSAWRQAGWTDNSHVIELLWIGATHELVAFYITYDWDRLSPGKMTRDAALGGSLDIGLDSGFGIGRGLGDADLATSEIDVEVLATLDSDLACHELLWGWQWWQHHVDGLDHVRARARDLSR
jgi:hypothetical protein